MKLLALGFALLSFQVSANPMLEKVKWMYEVYHGNEKDLKCDKTLNMGTASSSLTSGVEGVLIPKQTEVDCFISAPEVKTDIVSSVRNFYCVKKNDSSGTKMAEGKVLCGAAKKTDSTIVNVKLSKSDYKVKFFCTLD